MGAFLLNPFHLKHLQVIFSIDNDIPITGYKCLRRNVPMFPTSVLIVP